MMDLASESGSGLATVTRAPQRATLLVADDDSLVRKFVADALRREHLVVEASDSLEALDLMERHPDPIKLVISDIQMPNLDGFDVARWLFAWYPTVKLLLISGQDNDAAVQARLGRSDVPFLNKPFKAAVLSRTVRSLLSG